LVIEFLDEPYKTGEGKHYPSEKNPSGIFIGQKNILPDWNSSENEDVESESIPEFLERIVKFSENMKGKKIDREKVLIVQDKNSHPDNKKYFFSKECDFAGLIEFAQKQGDGLPGQLQRASKKDKLEGVSVLIVRAGRTGLKNLSKEECQSEAFSDEKRVSTGDIKVVVLEGVEHFRICQEGSSQIVEESIDFFGWLVYIIKSTTGRSTTNHSTNGFIWNIPTISTYITYSIHIGVSGVRNIPGYNL